jgi:hypothetical protein
MRSGWVLCTTWDNPIRMLERTSRTVTVLPRIAVGPKLVARHQRIALAAVLSLSVVSIGAGAMSLAIFTDSAASTGTFTSGTIDITSSPSVAFTVSAMMPGDASTAALTIANAGTGALRYSLTTVATNTLGSALTLTVKTLGTSCAAFDGTIVLAATALNGAAIGNPAQGADSGDRTLASATNEVLCFRISLPLTTGNAMQGISSTVTFTFDAEQTANN